jgi:hypothetical protein
MNKLLYTIAASLMLLGVTATTAAASDYVTPSGQTQVTLNEVGSNGSTTGFYFTPIGGKQWMGDIKINRIEGGAGHVYYSGTFQDRRLSAGPTTRCDGDILLDRTGANGVAPQVSLRVKWTIKGGTNCPSPAGQTFELQLTEALPKADRNGNYTANNANTANSQTNGTYTWPLWKVTAAEGKLNCRTTPNSKVVFTYRSGDRLDTRTRGVNAFQTATDGTSWLKVPAKQCVVRASDRAISPISIPF